VDACRGAQIGCVDCKKILAQNVVDTLAPFREKRTQLSANPGLVNDILAEGSRKATNEAAKTMEDVRAAIKL
jgi:tryptophanyl-tRNA synthetase